MKALELAAAAAEPARAPDPDAALVRAIRDGDRGAFDELYRRHVDAVHRRLTRLVGPDPERDDLVQHVFLAVFRSLPRFRGDAAFTTFLHRVVVNVACDHLRRRRRAPLAIPPETLALLPSGASPESDARQRQGLERAMALLARIKPKKRVAFVLRVVEGLSLEEIGSLVGASPAAVGQRVRHAQRELLAMVERGARRGKEQP
jgi:RNA polymerase sigma-70 factor (ECF subfamily)